MGKIRRLEARLGPAPDLKMSSKMASGASDGTGWSLSLDSPRAACNEIQRIDITSRS